MVFAQLHRFKCTYCYIILCFSVAVVISKAMFVGKSELSFRRSNIFVGGRKYSANCLPWNFSSGRRKNNRQLL